MEENLLVLNYSIPFVTRHLIYSLIAAYKIAFFKNLLPFSIEGVYFFGAAPRFARVGLCRSSLFARPCGLTAWVWRFAPLLSIPQPLIHFF